MNAVVTSFGSAGDMNPLLAIAAHLVRSGAAVTFVANPFYEDRVRRTGSHFIGAGKHFDVYAALEANPRYFNPRSGGQAILRELVLPSVRDTYPAVLNAVRSDGASMVVSHLLSFGGPWAAARAGVRSTIVTPTPFAWISPHRPGAFASWRAPSVLQSCLVWALRGAVRSMFGRPLHRLAAELGVPAAEAGFTASAQHAHLNLGLWPEWFRAPAPDDFPHSRLCGFVFDPEGRETPLPPDLEQFLEAGEPPVVVGFGSAAILHATERFRAMAAASERLGQRCLLIGASPGTVPASRTVKSVPAASYAQVFPRAAVIVHHGGFGTCAEALRAGKVSLVAPFAFDQYDTAAKLEDAGLGFWLRRGADQPDLAAEALGRALGNEPARAAAAAAAEKIAVAGNGAQRAAELIGDIA